ncbi:hypothetical protein ASPBRDRAFT_362399 [Aspergillus brasiliensis CBS 101740]|uniref:Uncharacterized protein n=1 Tax=Aspergillus brasiliensis (strain CBS 101740 / IMI 381727 / IBT 21946) TaxID=767769 RepID=A0A1L9U4T9_ASPBC|nr:hypothetical protein ASPBRDRAFT_362399 [Aspergillus brasiliensis CBS 101740]
MPSAENGDWRGRRWGKMEPNVTLPAIGSGPTTTVAPSRSSTQKGVTFQFPLAASKSINETILEKGQRMPGRLSDHPALSVRSHSIPPKYPVLTYLGIRVTGTLSKPYPHFHETHNAGLMTSIRSILDATLSLVNFIRAHLVHLSSYSSHFFRSTQERLPSLSQYRVTMSMPLKAASRVSLS